MIGKLGKYCDQGMSERFIAEKLNRSKKAIHDFLSDPQRYDQKNLPSGKIKLHD